MKLQKVRRGIPPWRKTEGTDDVTTVAPICPFAGLGVSLEPVCERVRTMRLRTRSAKRPLYVPRSVPVVAERWGYALQLVLGREACGS